MLQLFVFNSVQEANKAVFNLSQSGVNTENVGFLSLEQSYNSGLGDDDGSGAAGVAGETGGGLVGGGVIGALVGLAASAATLAIPGVGPILVTGPLAATFGSIGGTTAAGAVVGATVGGLSGFVESLVHQGADEAKAKKMAQTLQDGGAIVTVENHTLQEAQAAMGSVNIADMTSINNS